MKKIVMLALLALPMALFAQSSGDTKDIDGQKFTYDGTQWVHEALGDSYSVSKEYSTVYRDKTWQNWYNSGDATLKKIMDLGPNVVFKYKGSDGQFHNYGVYNSKAAMKAAVAAAGAGAAGAGAAGAGAAAAGTAGAVGGISTTALVIGGAAVVGGAVVIANDDDDESGSSTKR